MIDERTKNILKKIVPIRIVKTVYIIKKLFIYSYYDSSDYWRKRATDPGQAAVLWENQEYNQLFRILEKDIIIRFLPTQENTQCRILDIGCGIGVVSKMLVDTYPNVIIDAVDFPEMIQVAKINNPSDRIDYIESSAEEYFHSSKKYNFIISSACFSAIRNIDKMKKGVINVTKMLDEGGIILMIDPLHRWSFLARVKFSSKDMEKFLKTQNFSLYYKSGVLFWPYRIFLANSKVYGVDLKNKFNRGEWLLSIMGRHFWADYKILVFKKNK